ncbi:DnaJ domain-containing protein [Microcella daejeonensis]|uniref:J domain-containing protein n=1 Tax=Microcella daejeonensis TaxID=2994971 RepID=UPI00227025A8|nr:DnaJ domain-containing protein [Microcella daejeonensis]WAB83186.1 DnaJ domain-containing protein [Microcella daejeonensis]
MSESPLAANPYEVLGVAPTASDDDLKKAYRRRLREAHPDTGGSSAEFDRVQQAWQRIGTAQARQAYDAGGDASSGGSAAWSYGAAGGGARRGDTRPSARSSGHPGGWYREQYLRLMREWAGRGTELDDPYDPRLVRTAPREIKHLLAAAVAEERTATALATLGMGFTIWHDVVAGPTPEDKVDHVVLGPTGLWAVLSEDWGSEVRVKRGDLIGEGLAPGERPLHQLGTRAKVVARAAKARFSALVIVVEDGQAPGSLTELGSVRGAQGMLVERSRLVNLIRTGLPGVGVGGTDLFEVRTRLQSSIRFV